MKKSVPRKNLQAAGLRVTQPRLSIFRLLAQSSKRHLSADDIHAQLAHGDNEIPLATVYRVLTQFEQAGLVTRHNFENGYSVFELDSGDHHDHMICVETGEVMEFVNEDIERLQKEIASAAGYDLIDHSLVLYVRKRR
ncbi:MAG: ferric iron uptake transcriptional regulator [Gammaproteobacteria bacterium]|nr:ferric iron uptake transcriptional regulator [Gammaproteobacteria bacterium]MCY4164892.1 ferric iron uptake transcriptional regulator [Gammaproteobacteria bacterium]